MSAATTRRGWRATIRRRVPGVAGPVAVAVLADLVLDELLARSTGAPVRIAPRLAGFVAGAAIAYLFGMFLGLVVWPRVGRRFSAYLLRRSMGSPRKPRVFLTDHADFDISLTRRVLEVVGFVAGVSVILTVALTFVQLPSPLISALAGLLTILTLFASFLLVPYWVFGRMGLRQVDKTRWLVQPLGRRYAQRLRLSNGALLLVAFGAIVNLAFRAGATPRAALFDAWQLVGRSIAAVLIIAATAVSYYLRGEHDLMTDLEAEAMRDGVMDGRGMTDEEFLPRRS